MQPSSPEKRESNAKPANLDRLPFELLSTVFEHLGLASLSSVLLVCRRLKDAALEEFWTKWALTRLDGLRIRRFLDYADSVDLARRNEPNSLLGILLPPLPPRTLRLTGFFHHPRNVARLFKSWATRLRTLDLADTSGLDVLKWGPTNDGALERMIATAGSGGLERLLLPKEWSWRYQDIVYTTFPEYATMAHTEARKPTLGDWVVERLATVLRERHPDAKWLANLKEIAVTTDIWVASDLRRLLEAWGGLVGEKKLRKLELRIRHLVPDWFIEQTEGGFGDQPGQGEAPLVDSTSEPIPEPPLPLLANLVSLTLDFGFARGDLKESLVASSFLLSTLLAQCPLRSLTIRNVEYLDAYKLELPESLESLDLYGCGLTVSSWKSLLANPPPLRFLSMDVTKLRTPYPIKMEDDLDDPVPSPAGFLACLSRLETLELHLPPVKFAGVVEDHTIRFPRKIMGHLEATNPRAWVVLHSYPSLESTDRGLLRAQVQLLDPLFPMQAVAEMVRSFTLHVIPPIRASHVDLLADAYSRFSNASRFSVLPQGGELWSGDEVIKKLMRDRGCGDCWIEMGGLRGGGGMELGRDELEKLLLA